MNATSLLRALSLPVALAAAGAALADVPTVAVEARPVSVTHAAEATLEAVHQVTVAARVPGRIVELRVDAGDLVRRGDLLARIDAAEADQAVAGAQAAVAQAEAQLARTRLDYERARSLRERDFVSASAVDQARAALLAAEAQVRAARAGQGQAAVVLGYTAIEAPLAGIVAARHAESGEMAQPGRALVTLFDPAAMRAVVDVPQQRLAGIAAERLRAHVELPESGRWSEAAGLTVLPAADARTHSVRVRVDLPEGVEGVKPGTFARVHFVTGEAVRMVVPGAAVLRRGELTGVYVADGRGSFALRQIRVGMPRPDGTVEVLAGLRSGEEVALDPVQAGVFARAATR